MVVWNITPVEVDPSRRLRAVGEEGSLLGTDQLGRDLFHWTIAGFAWSGSVAAVAATLVTMIGLVIGLTAGSSRGALQAVAARLIDTTLSLPYLVIAVAIMAAVGRGFWPLAITLGSVSWPIFARVVYAETRGLMQREYVKAARLLGVSRLRTLLTHVLPGLRNTIMVMWAFMFADLLVAESGLSFLGIGAPLGTPSLGNILADGRLYLLVAPRMVIVPAAAIVLAVTAANMIGDGVAVHHRQRATAVNE
jgi:peptide/nickel transport system permease protein